MSKRIGVLVVTACLGSTGCITGFTHPLGPVEDGFIEPGLVGTWACVSDDEDSKPAQITIMDFDGKQYYLESLDERESKPGRVRGFATLVNDVPFLNLRDLGPDPSTDWTFVTYGLPDSDHLILRGVDPRSFEDVLEDVANLRERLGSQLDDPEVILVTLSCTRAPTPPAKS